MLRALLIPAVADAAACVVCFFLLRGALAQACAQSAHGEDTRGKACIPFVCVLLGGARNGYTDTHEGMRRRLM